MEAESSQSESMILKQENEFKQSKRRGICGSCNKIFESVGPEIWFGLTFLGRLVMTLYSLHGLFFIYNFIIQFIILIPGRLYDLKSIGLQWVFGLLFILFAMVSSNVLIIPTYDFLLFPYLRFRNPLAHLHSLIRAKLVIDDNKVRLKRDGDEESIQNQNMPLLNFLLILIGFLYVFGFFIGLLFSATLKEYVTIFVLFISYTYYTFLFLGYALLCIYFLIKCIVFSCKHNKGCCTVFIKTFDLNSYFGDPDKKRINQDYNINDEISDKNSKENENEHIERDLPPLPRLNLLSYVIHPVLMKAYRFEQRDENTEKKHCEDYWLYIKNFSRIFLFLYALFLVIFDLVNQKSKRDPLAFIFFVLFFILMLMISIVLNFPVCCRNQKSFGSRGFFTGKVKYKRNYKMLFPNMVSFVRLMCNAIISLCAIMLFAIFSIFEESNALEKLYDINLESKKSKVDRKSLLLPNLCYSSMFNIPIYLLMPIINDAYYFNDKDLENKEPYHSSLQIANYRNFFYDERYYIDNITSLINRTGSDTVKKVQYNIRKKDTKMEEVTILSIKGTSNKKDVFIDFQLYFPSILLSLLTAFSIEQKGSLSIKFIEYSLSIPYRTFFQYSLIQSYLNALKKAYMDNFNYFYKNIIIVGHSLGGGLAKLLGRLLSKQAVSLSGPGVNAFHSLWGYEGNSENFEISAVDLVPDMDLVPRVEVSGGTVYRIVCKLGPFNCHMKENSLCEVLTMCRNPNYEEYCKTIAQLDDDYIKELYSSSELNYIFGE